MAVPSFQSLMLPALTALADGVVHRPQEVSDKVAAQLGVSAEDQAEPLPSGAMPRYRNRVLWALHHMKRAGVIRSPGRGQYVITDSGRALLAETPTGITTKTLERYPEYMDFVERGRRKPDDAAVDGADAATPEERLQAAYEEMRDHVAAEILDLLRAIDPRRFESVVLEVLTAMGYGGSDPDRASLTAYSHDGGLDGVIKEDTLGLDQVVVQAKRHSSPVDVKLVREFAGSLDEHGTDKGVFFTTDKFTGPAIDYAKSIKKRIILIDGPELARLMVRHGVGVTVTKTLQLARLDSDYFDPDVEA
ncbi:MAG: restriction endonuclease [Actinomycetes bacterium]